MPCGQRPSWPTRIAHVLRDSVAAVSVGIVDGRPVLDLDYVEDVDASVDMNVVMTGRGQFVEVQGTGEEATFSQAELDALVPWPASVSRSFGGGSGSALGPIGRLGGSA